MNEEKILLSICIPTRNRADLLYKLVTECLSIQSNKIEVVVSDNCSTDNTQALMESVKDSRFKYYRLNENIGYANIGVAIAKGTGKFCLLIRDKDFIPNIDAWFHETENILESSADTTVFRGILISAKNSVMAGIPNKILKKNTFEIFHSIFYGSTYSTSIIFPRKIVGEIFEKALSNSPYMWSLYPHVVLMYYCALFGDMIPMKNLVVKMRVENKEIYFDKATAHKGLANLPYATVAARRKQMSENIALFKHLNLPNEIKIPLLAYSTDRLCSWINVAFDAEFTWEYIPKNFPKYQYWHYVFWENYLSLVQEIRDLFGISVLDMTIGAIFQRYNQFCIQIVNKETAESHK